ncbi:MAG: hypothetical protein IJ722_03465 [Alloprevotella sp.]|nr:hypothetical protein [Alloprevotella sp.]
MTAFIRYGREVPVTDWRYRLYGRWRVFLRPLRSLRHDIREVLSRTWAGTLWRRFKYRSEGKRSASAS